MKNSCLFFLIFFNLFLIINFYDTYSRNKTLEVLNQHYLMHYIPYETYKKTRDKVWDYEWILHNVAKVEDVEAMRINWCGR